MFNSAGYNTTTTFTINLSGWDTSNVTDMSYMFSDAGYKAATWDIGDIHDWNVSKVKNRTRFIDWGQTNIDKTKPPWQSP